MPKISLLGLVLDYIAILEPITVARGMERADWLHADLDVAWGREQEKGDFPKKSQVTLKGSEWIWGRQNAQAPSQYPQPKAQ